MTSPYLEKRLRSEREARHDIWRAIDSWTKPAEPKTECSTPGCDADALPGEIYCHDCFDDWQAAKEKERERARAYRGPCFGKEDWK